LQIIKIHTKKKPLAQDVDLDRLAGDMEGYTGADIASVASAAVMAALRGHIAKYGDPQEAEKHASELKIGMQHFRDAMIRVRPLSMQELDMYREIAEKFGTPRASAA
jgi:transitional endoplasmic reticulum ATPase